MICLSAVPSMSNEVSRQFKMPLCFVSYSQCGTDIRASRIGSIAPPKSVYLPYAKAKDSFELDFTPCLHRSQSSDSGVQWALLAKFLSRGCSQNIRGTIK